MPTSRGVPSGLRSEEREERSNGSHTEGLLASDMVWWGATTGKFDTMRHGNVAPAAPTFSAVEGMCRSAGMRCTVGDGGRERERRSLVPAHVLLILRRCSLQPRLFHLRRTAHGKEGTAYRTRRRKDGRKGMEYSRNIQKRASCWVLQFVRDGATRGSRGEERGCLSPLFPSFRRRSVSSRMLAAACSSWRFRPAAKSEAFGLL